MNDFRALGATVVITLVILLTSLYSSCSLGLMDSVGPASITATAGYKTVAYLPLDGSTANVVGISSVTNVASGLSYGSDRGGKVGSALEIPSGTQTLQSSGEFQLNVDLPKSFTISFWFSLLSSSLPTGGLLDIAQSISTANSSGGTGAASSEPGMSAQSLAINGDTITLQLVWYVNDLSFWLRIPPLTIRRWYLATFTTDDLGIARVYIDKRLIGRMKEPNFDYVTAKPFGFVFGSSAVQGTSSAPFWALDDLSVFNGALTAKQVEQLYTGTLKLH